VLVHGQASRSLQRDRHDQSDVPHSGMAMGRRNDRARTSRLWIATNVPGLLLLISAQARSARHGQVDHVEPLRSVWTLDGTVTFASDSDPQVVTKAVRAPRPEASIAARSPAPPAPTTRTSYSWCSYLFMFLD